MLTSTIVWDNVMKSGVLPRRSAESMRGFVKQNKALTLNEIFLKLKDMNTRFSHSFKKPRRPFVAEDIDQASDKKKAPSTNKGGRPRKHPEEKKSKRAKKETPQKPAEDDDDITPDQPEEPVEASSNEQSKRKRVRKEIQKRRLIKKETPPASDEEVE